MDVYFASGRGRARLLNEVRVHGGRATAFIGLGSGSVNRGTMGDGRRGCGDECANDSLGAEGSSR